MKVPSKFVSALAPDQIKRLQQLMASDPCRRVRHRAHGILLSSQGRSIDEIAQIYQVHRNTVSSWIERWWSSGTAGLYDQPRSGNPGRLTEPEHEVAKALLEAHPHSPKRVLALLAQQTGKTISASTLRRIAKGEGLRWKRVRKSVKSKRNQAAFEAAEQELTALKKTGRRSN